MPALHRQERGICQGAFLEDLPDHPKLVRRDSHHAQLCQEGRTPNGAPLGSLRDQPLFEMLINELTEGIAAVLIKSACSMQKEKG